MNDTSQRIKLSSETMPEYRSSKNWNNQGADVQSYSCRLCVPSRYPAVKTQTTISLLCSQGCLNTCFRVDGELIGPAGMQGSFGLRVGSWFSLTTNLQCQTISMSRDCPIDSPQKQQSTNLNPHFGCYELVPNCSAEHTHTHSLHWPADPWQISRLNVKAAFVWQPVIPLHGIESARLVKDPILSCRIC